MLTCCASFFLCPETGGKTLEEVDFLFGEGKVAWRNYTVSAFGDAVWVDKSEEHQVEKADG